MLPHTSQRLPTKQKSARPRHTC